MEEDLSVSLDLINRRLNNIAFCVAIIAREDAYMDEKEIIDKIIEK